jgi:hypothetical protein
MGRPLQGWKLRPKGAKNIQHVYFTWDGKQVERSTGTADLEGASRERGGSTPRSLQDVEKPGSEIISLDRVRQGRKSIP